jgi:hypothetical protein
LGIGHETPYQGLLFERCLQKVGCEWDPLGIGCVDGGSVVTVCRSSGTAGWTLARGACCGTSVHRAVGRWGLAVAATAATLLYVFSRRYGNTASWGHVSGQLFPEISKETTYFVPSACLLWMTAGPPVPPQCSDSLQMRFGVGSGLRCARGSWPHAAAVIGHGEHVPS